MDNGVRIFVADDMKCIISLITLFISLCLISMSTHNAISHRSYTDSITIMSYNVENLFDTIDDVQTDDEEFTPQGSKHWTKYRYYKKLRHLAQVVSRVGGKHWPSLVCLVEVENAGVLNDLLSQTALGKKGYKYVITHSQDPRGIDVAFLYRPSELTLVSRQELNPIFTQDPERKSRNVLELHLRLNNGEELYVFGVHLPSRREGVKISEPLRCDVARLIRSRCDSIYEILTTEQRKHTHFIIMGDFNEEAHEEAIAHELGSLSQLPRADESSLGDTLQLYSLMHPRIEPRNKKQFPRGSYCYQRVWTQLDHFIISESMLKEHAHLRYISGSARNYFASYLASEQVVAGFPTPWRTYGGNHYIGGYSDHYPIVLRLSIAE